MGAQHQRSGFRVALDEIPAGAQGLSRIEIHPGRPPRFGHLGRHVEYVPGDDIRLIDWNVSARTGSPFVKVFSEERELSMMLVVDMSRSGTFGTSYRMKDEVAIEICALLAFSAMKNNDKVGLLIFTDKVEKFIPPRKGRQHVLRVLREIIYHEPENTGTNIKSA
ncbi:MAG: DUF58 domain-containing protein, partial [SAR324 cluster bacterium]|nr:DUF58 domain-containing protein [SAR324 cluster bacterium]